MAYVAAGYWVPGYAIGDAGDATAPGAALTGAGTLSAGSAAGGDGNATAPGVTLTGAGALSAGAASSVFLTSDDKFTVIGQARINTVGASARRYKIAKRSS